MFIWSMKMKKGRIVFILLGLLIIACLTVWFVGTQNKDEKTGETKLSATDIAMTAKTEAEIIKYIRSFGWEIEEKACEKVEVKVPKKFDDVYTKYNDLQKNQGFDLEKLKGKTVTRTTFVVTNYPNYPENIRADILTHKDKIVGGDICSIEIEGFMHALNESR